ncbi:hypothetical protein PAP_01840 [Palaeococcus pacificus DY20341]|uniref:DUF106 domain-containing protein n=1 Tax=Palaeococcus pacificus DY20341 TaxID=1343739 RepID=A0A075LQ34_9EURY|nr:EMC3/TMCO1 family protein [Palaeococcus pacificus]AIF68805.1 hypothetical protein PAP_01840 [Palaeococcus pacificus DY20341]
MIEVIHNALDAAFGGIILSLQPIWVATIFGAIMGVFYTLVNRKFVDQEKMKKLQEMNKQFQKEWKEAQKNKDEKKMKKLQQKQIEMLKLQNEVMKDSMFKPMLISFPMFIIFYGWLARYYVETAIVKIPFNFFLVDWFHGMYHSSLQANELGFLGWYFLTTYIVGSILRKILDMA